MGGGKHKYNAKKTYVDGIKFDSKKEAERYVVPCPPLDTVLNYSIVD